MIKSEMEKLAGILKEARKNHGFTQAEVARKLGVTFQAVSNYERGINNIDDETLARLCNLYEIPFQRTVDSINYKEIAEKLKQARTKKKLTQSQVAERLGISVKTIRGYETGKVEIPVHQIQLLCGIYDIEVGSVIEKNVLLFRFSNDAVFTDIKAYFIQFADDLRKIADEVEGIFEGEDDQLREISVKFKLDITERF